MEQFFEFRLFWEMPLKGKNVKQMEYYFIPVSKILLIEEHKYGFNVHVDADIINRIALHRFQKTPTPKYITITDGEFDGFKKCYKINYEDLWEGFDELLNKDVKKYPELYPDSKIKSTKVDSL